MFVKFKQIQLVEDIHIKKINLMDEITKARNAKRGTGGWECVASGSYIENSYWRTRKLPYTRGKDGKRSTEIARSIRPDIEPNISSSGSPTQSISTYYCSRLRLIETSQVSGCLKVTYELHHQYKAHRDRCYCHGYCLWKWRHTFFLQGFWRILK